MIAFFRPRSPVEKMSSLPRVNIRNISAVHWPMPLTLTSSVMISSLDRLVNEARIISLL